MKRWANNVKAGTRPQEVEDEVAQAVAQYKSDNPNPVLHKFKEEDAKAEANRLNDLKKLGIIK